MKKPSLPDEELNAYVDGELAPPQRDGVAAWLEQDAAAAETVRAYGAQDQGIRQLFGAVAEEALPERLLLAARAPALQAAQPAPPGLHVPVAAGAGNGAAPEEGMVVRQSSATPAVPMAVDAAPTGHTAGPLPRWSLSRLAAGVLIAVCSGAAGWLAHGQWQAQQSAQQLAAQSVNLRQAVAMATFARQAAVAHAVYSPDIRRPVEITAEQEEQLVTWLSKRLKANVRPPKLGALGYELIGGRLLPGASGPVAQFMYNDATGRRMTLYVSADNKDNKDTAFRFAQEGDVSVFYWIDGQFGYALSANIGKAELAKLATAVYGQLERRDGR